MCPECELTCEMEGRIETFSPMSSRGLKRAHAGTSKWMLIVGIVEFKFRKAFWYSSGVIGLCTESVSLRLSFDYHEPAFKHPTVKFLRFRLSYVISFNSSLKAKLKNAYAPPCIYFLFETVSFSLPQLLWVFQPLAPLAIRSRVNAEPRNRVSDYTSQIAHFLKIHAQYKIPSPQSHEVDRS